MTQILRAHQVGPRLVPAVLVDAHERARAILAQAAETCDSMRAAAQAECDTIAERAAREAREQAKLEARAEFASALEALSHAREQWLVGLPPQLIELAMAAAEHIVGSELQMHPERIETIARPLLERLRRAQRIELHLNPDDEAWLRTALPDLRRDLGERAAIELTADPAIARGGCLLVSDIGAIDARLPTRFERLESALRQAAQPDGR